MSPPGNKAPTRAKTKTTRGTPRVRGFKVGITVSIKDGGDLALFTNGLRQNVWQLFKLFESSADCAAAWLVAERLPEEPIKGETFGVPLEAFRPLPDVEDELDYLIVIGAAINVAVLKRLRARGCKVILYKGGNGGVISMADIVAKPPKPTAETYDDHDCYDQIWVTSQHMRTYAGWCRTIYRCPVIEIPQIWSPLFGDVLKKSKTIKFGFAPPKPEWRIGVMDPNNTVMKTSHYPMLVAEAAYREKPEIIQSLMVSSALQFAENEHFRRFANLLTLQPAGKLTVEDRYISWVFMAKYCDAIVTHQWENGLNYLYYEVLSGDYPLIHNSKFLMDYGYYYEDFNPESGAAALIRAHATHVENLDAYRAANAALFARLDPTAQHNIDLHQGLLFKA